MSILVTKAEVSQIACASPQHVVIDLRGHFNNNNRAYTSIPVPVTFTEYCVALYVAASIPSARIVLVSLVHLELTLCSPGIRVPHRRLSHFKATLVLRKGSASSRRTPSPAGVSPIWTMRIASVKVESRGLRLLFPLHIDCLQFHQQRSCPS